MTMQIAQHKTQSASRAARLKFALQMAEQTTKVGDRIAQERKARNWSRPELARRLPGVTTGNDVYRWETGKHMPRSDTLEGIADLFEIDVADLYAGPVSDEPKPKPEQLLSELSAATRESALTEAVAELTARVKALETQLTAELGKVQKALEAQQKQLERAARSPAKGTRKK